MSSSADALGRYAALAVSSAAEELRVEPLALARRLGDAEIARLVHLLNAALTHVEHRGLRHRIEDLLMSVTDGHMPAEPESELDWALKAVRRRAHRRKGDVPSESSPDPDPED